MNNQLHSAEDKPGANSPDRKRLIIASNNAGKLREFAKLLEPFGFDVISMREAGFSDEIIEDGETFEENAHIKAKAVYEATGLPTIADDSGLEVDALNGAPGVYSARYAGEPCNDSNNNQKLLSALDAVPDGKRGARFVSVVAYLDPATGETKLFRGECPGVILREERGQDGFGYDPLFYLPSLGKTYAEITTEEKNGVSHRGQAMRLLAAYLKEQRSHD